MQVLQLLARSLPSNHLYFLQQSYNLRMTVGFQPARARTSSARYLRLRERRLVHPLLAKIMDRSFDLRTAAVNDALGCNGRAHSAHLIRSLLFLRFEKPCKICEQLRVTGLTQLHASACFSQRNESMRPSLP